METMLANVACGTAGSSTDITLISPHKFSVTSGFGCVLAPPLLCDHEVADRGSFGLACRYFNGCDGAGADCSAANCTTALHNSSDTSLRVTCQEDNVSCSLCPSGVSVCMLTSFSTPR